MARIIVDLTEFNTWQGHLTGVQRVIFSLGEALYDSNNTVSFMSFVGNGNFREINWQDFRERVYSTGAQPSGNNSSSMKQRAKSIAKMTYYKSPKFIRDYMTAERKEKTKKLVKGVYRRLKRIKDFRVSLPSSKLQNVNFVFKSGDIILSAGRAWEDFSYIDALERTKKTNKVKLAFIVHDLVPIYQQQTFSGGLTEKYSHYLYKVLKMADVILAISKSTKHDLLKYAKEVGIINIPIVRTIRWGDDLPKSSVNTPLSFIRNPESFAISVGTIEARKNHAEIYYAYKLAAQRGISLPDMYIIGRPGWLVGDILYYIKNDTDTKDKITILHNVSDPELSWLYNNALFTVYPSQYEGWGLPVAESLAYSTPVIASNTSSIPEIAPELVDLVSPFDASDLLDKMTFYSQRINSDNKRQEIANSYKIHSWRETANRLASILNNNN